MLENSVPPSGLPSRRGIRMPYNTFTKPITSRYDMSVCQSWPASAAPMYLPFSFDFDRIPTTGTSLPSLVSGPRDGP